MDSFSRRMDWQSCPAAKSLLLIMATVVSKFSTAKAHISVNLILWTRLFITEVATDTQRTPLGLRP
jgi:hypothetical protein